MKPNEVNAEYLRRAMVDGIPSLRFSASILKIAGGRYELFLDEVGDEGTKGREMHASLTEGEFNNLRNLSLAIRGKK